MNKYLSTVVITALVVALAATWLGRGDGGLGGGFGQISGFKSNQASSTAMTVGDELSTAVLGERSLRAYWQACSSSLIAAGQNIYLVLSDTAVLATTTGVLVELEPGECYESDRQTVYADIVHAIGLGATTTDALFVTEYFDLD